MDSGDNYSLGAAFSGLQNPGMADNFAFRGGTAPAYKPGDATPVRFGDHTAIHIGEHRQLFTTGNHVSSHSGSHVAELHSVQSTRTVGRHVDIAG